MDDFHIKIWEGIISIVRACLLRLPPIPDRETKKRIPTESAAVYGEIARGNTLPE
jgi:hypothetical protein